MAEPTEEIDVQTTLDTWLAEHTDVQQYVMKLYYVPDGAEIPLPVTHMVRCTAVDEPQLELRVGVVATPNTAAVANVILRMIEHAAGDPKVM
jgi:hypothetical protein